MSSLLDRIKKWLKPRESPEAGEAPSAGGGGGDAGEEVTEAEREAPVTPPGESERGSRLDPRD